ncbi:energy-coupling factor ABC transporter ATP-binding protein [Corynebacterium kozikiae]|uniref:energy-coupling factor ABC transporter ATP-binding protein n=1 Tax=Corynebacterium kozikiae TaxID=2968469 RepID=UPI00211B787B|nr:ABC transporter ATP-binding protein [Corynebacterium sp. 76QC2CO]MCQ9342434.1 energy-coupling factor ABC transporter ATP-binding protein [Corynebacterium sp. 76QC2CO]
MARIIFNDVSVTYGDVGVLSHITTEITEQRVAVIGANGGGKSTLVRLINGLSEATSGEVLVDGRNVAREAKAVRKKVGFVFSDAENQIVMPTVREDIAFSLRRFKLSKEEKQHKVEQTMERFGLSKLADNSPHTLSGGQKQLLALASVLVIDPDVVIADEPTTLLDFRNRELIREVFASLSQQLIVVTHDLDFITDFDRALCVDNHRIAADGAPTDVIRYYMEETRP